jgi:ABC-type phosphate transport system substrate-binding protein
MQLQVAIDGLTVVVRRGGRADTCIKNVLPGGLTTGQLRWIYSSWTVAQMQATPANSWTLAELGNPGSNPNDRTWNKLNAGCFDAEINIAGADSLSGTYEYFKETILIGGSMEFFDNSRSMGYYNSTFDEDIDAYVEADEAAIGYFGYAYYAANQRNLDAVPVRNRAGDFITPSPRTVANGQYNPLSRKIYMNLWTQAAAIARTRPFLEYGYSTPGNTDVVGTGYVPITDGDKFRMLTRMGSNLGASLGGITCGSGGQLPIATVEELEPHFDVWWKVYADKCPKVTPTLGTRPTAADISRRVCGFSTNAAGRPIGAAASIGGTGATAITGATCNAQDKCTCQGGASRTLTEYLAAPGLNAYAWDASAPLSISRNLIRFSLGDDGSKAVTFVGGTPLGSAQRTAQLAKFPNPPPAFCFDGESTVEEMNKGSIAMKDLAIGDMVKVAGGKFSEVYSFGHYEQGVETTYLSIDAGLDKPLLITPDHMVFVGGKATPASTVSVGDELTLVDGAAIVKKIETVAGKGAFAPFTKEGSLVVNGVVASSYVSLQDENASFAIGGVKLFNMHSLAHLFQAPHRVVCELNSAFCSSETYTNGVSAWVKAPLAASQWLVEQNALVMTAAFLPAFAFVLVAAAVEAIMVSPVLLVAAIAAVLFARSKKAKTA